MHSLWFKQRYEKDILNGDKQSTYRVKRPRFVDDDVVSASVGPRRPFAFLRIDRIDEIAISDLSDETRTAMQSVYDLTNVETVFHIHFTPVNSK